MVTLCPAFASAIPEHRPHMPAPVIKTDGLSEVIVAVI
jgi:hypothetical protein